MRRDLDQLLWHAKRPIRWARRSARALRRTLRYGRVPAGGWGHGWRILVFRYQDGAQEMLHVLAPVAGDDFDWDHLNRLFRDEPWPVIAHPPGTLTGALKAGGHHLYVVAENDSRPQRLSMGKLVPGEFGGGLDRSFVLIAVRDAGL